MPSPPLRALLPGDRLRRLALAAGLAALVALGAHAAGGSAVVSPGGARVGGDLPGFLGAARILAERDASALYDPAAQAAAQAGLLPAGAGYVRFAYPPVVAAAYVPLLAIPYRLAVLLHALGGAILVGAAAARMTTAWRGLSGWALPAAGATLAFYPLLRAVGGGQNTPLSLLCAVAAATASGPVAAGAWAAAWAFKPQLAAPVLLAVVVSRPRAALGAGLGLAAAWAANAAVLGPGWAGTWARAGLAFQGADSAVDAPSSVSLVDRAGGLDGPGALVALVGVVLLAGAARRLREDPPRVVALAVAAAPLLAPHALYYDAGVLALPLGLIAARSGRRALPLLLAAWLGAALALVLPPGATLLVVTAGTVGATISSLAGPARPIDTGGGRR